jgi:glycosyltransferase involved in cell wall biosynthesis
MATYNRADVLPETFRYLTKQDLPPESFEVIVADDGSPDNTMEVMVEIMKQMPFQVRYIRHENRGPGYAQNTGIRAATAPVVVLMPDDIFMMPGGIRAHLTSHKTHPEQHVAVLGHIVQAPTLNQSVFLRTWDPYRFEQLPELDEYPYYMFWAINISVKRDFMLKYGMFAEDLGRGGPAAHEDVELGYRLYKHGLKIIHNKEALGYHYHYSTLDAAIRRAYERGLNLGDLFQRVPEPELVVKYHVLHGGTLGAHMRTFAGPRRRLLIGSDRHMVLLTIHYVLRFLLFNHLLVEYLWVPLLRAAEHKPVLARLAHRNLYRGAIAHYTQRGERDARKRYGY